MARDARPASEGASRNYRLARVRIVARFHARQGPLSEGAAVLRELGITLLGSSNSDGGVTANVLYGGARARGGYRSRDVDRPPPASSRTNPTCLGRLQQSTAPAAASNEACMAGSVHA
jgi:hypothetical protein